MERRTFNSLADIESLERRPYADVVPVTSTLAIFERSARLFGSRIALTYLESGEIGTPVREFTYAELLANICRAANLFRSLGVGPQDAVAILAPNMPETHFALWGAQVAGRACPINNLLGAENVAALAKAAGARVAVVLGPNAEVDIWGRAGALRAAGVQVLQINVDRTPASDTPVFQDLLAAQPDALVFDPGLTRERIAACFHTGGTTGAPKLALHTHGNEVHTSWFAPCYYDFDEHTVEINGFPLFHVAGAFVYGLACFSVGARQVLPTLSGMRSAAFVRNYWHFCERFGVTALACVPTIMATLLGQPPGGAAARSVKVALTGGSPLPSELALQFEAHTGIAVRNILGMTESAGLVTIGLARAPRVPGSTGLRMPYSECRAYRLVDGAADFGAPCAAGETGVIALRGPHVSPGYSVAARNAGMFTADGWLVSGDLGHVDAGGNVFVTGRSKDVIIRGAHNIDPGSVEEAFLGHPEVSMCAVVGEPDAHAGELPVAFVTRKPGATCDAAAILTTVSPHIAERPAVPKRVTVIDAMPMTAIGKIYKPALRLNATETKVDEMLAGIDGATVRCEAVDDGGIISAILHLRCGGDRAAPEAQVRKRMTALALTWRIEWG